MALLKRNGASGLSRQDWREHPKHLAARDELQALRDRLPGLRAAIEPQAILAQDVAARKRRVERFELELLAGRRSEADVAVERNAYIDAQRRMILAEIALEDALAAEEKLAAEADKQRKAAKQIAADSIRARYKQALIDVKDAMSRAMAADQSLHQVLLDLDAQFPANHNPLGNLVPDEDGFDKHLKLQHRFSGGERIPSLLEQIDQALAAMDAEA